MNLKELQDEVNGRWGRQDSNPCHRSDTNHALVHMTKALGKLASALNDAEHEARPLRPSEIDKYLADLVICAARFGHGTVDLDAACTSRLAEKFPSAQRAEDPLRTPRVVRDRQFDLETRRDLSNEIADWLGLDGQYPHRTKEDEVTAIDLRQMDEKNRETMIAEFRGNEINGPNAGLDSIVRMIESATLRDACTRYGNVVYAIYFHLSGGQMNRGRYPFIVPGGAHRYRNGRNGKPRATVEGPG